MSEFKYLECRIGGVIGISDSLIKKARKAVLERDEDFQLVDGRISYTEEGVAKLIGFLQGPEVGDKTRRMAKVIGVSAVLEAIVIQDVPPEKRPLLLGVPWVIPAAVLIVTRIFPRNSKIMHAKLHPEWIEKNGAAYQSKTGIDPAQLTHRIRVRSTKKFAIGMEVPCDWRQADLWECNRPMPRRKGKWN